MTQIAPHIRLMTLEETRASQLIHAGSVIELEGATIHIATGRSDQVHVFKESTVFYVLSINHKHEYIGMEIFDAASGEEYENIFIQNQWELEDYLGMRWRELAPKTIARKLREFLA